MSFFTQEGLRTFLSQVFYEVPFVEWIIPLQGNFRNPQDGADDDVPVTWLTRAQLLAPNGKNKSDTWIGFLKMDSDPRVMAHYGADTNAVDGTGALVPGKSFSRVFTNSQCRLQIVGRQSEQWAESVKHWLQRADVLSMLADMDAQLYADGLGRIEVSTFVQSGLNSVLAYNVFFKVEWASTIDVADQTLITGADITGTVAVLN